MMSLVNKSANWTPNYHKILIFSPPKSLKRLRAARIDQLADSNEPAITCENTENLDRILVFQVEFNRRREKTTDSAHFGNKKEGHTPCSEK